jgi:RimJ/RimL family protein N-acetyltransferase
MSNHVSLELLSEDKSEWLDLCSSIGDAMFTTDRVALDPMFDVSTANKRYKNWLMDIWENRSASACRILYKGDNIGFNAISFKSDTQTAFNILSGIFKTYHGKSLGGAMIHAPIVFSAEKGIKLYSTTISSNNQAVFRLYLHFGFNIESSSYVFRYCSDKN